MASSLLLNTMPIVTVDDDLTEGHRPEVIIANELGIPGGPVTVEDGGDVAQGATDDAAADAGGEGSLSAKLRLATTQLDDITTATESTQAAAEAVENSIGAVADAAEEDPEQSATVIALLKGILAQMVDLNAALVTANGLLDDIKTNTTE